MGRRTWSIFREREPANCLRIDAKEDDFVHEYSLAEELNSHACLTVYQHSCIRTRSLYQATIYGRSQQSRSSSSSRCPFSEGVQKRQECLAGAIMLVDRLLLNEISIHDVSCHVIHVENKTSRSRLPHGQIVALGCKILFFSYPQITS